MRFTILSAGTGWHTERLEAAFSRRGHTARTLPVEALASRMGVLPRMSAGGPGLDGDAAVLVRIVPRGSLEQIVFRMDALHRLEILGIPVVNPPRGLERAVDKSYTSALLEQAGLPTPRTVAAERAEDALAAFELFGDCVVKPLFGSNGNGLVRLSDPDLAHRAFRALEFERAVFYVQEMLPHPGYDVRAFVVGGRVIAAMTRHSPDWRTNLARGGRAAQRDLAPLEEEFALRAAEALGLDYAGVDLMPLPDGRVFVIEVNGSPGWEGLQATTAVDVAGELAGLVIARSRAACRAGVNVA
ncbi:MAG: RimK family alpha-L-glutamate ligase [Gemmatimonadetes bacterium]|nr:RimK family alpha-L-glutamate ligase [Gemmatimonadota bacterium]